MTEKLFVVKGTIVVDTQRPFMADTPQSAAKIFVQQTGRRPDCVEFDGKSVAVICMCSLCGNGILDGDRVISDQDGVTVCRDCNEAYGGKGTQEWWRRRQQP